MLKIAVSSGNGPLVIEMLNKQWEKWELRKGEDPWKPDLFKVLKFKFNKLIL